jgi:HEAT repeat protein
MSITDQLSSQVGDKTEQSNIKVVELCIKDSSKLTEIAEGLQSKDIALIGDCTEVFTKVAQLQRDLVVPFADDLIPLLTHRNTRVRWEAMHAMSLISELVPNKIKPILPQLKGQIVTDDSTIVRDYAVDAVSNYGKTSKEAAEEAFPVLTLTLDEWLHKHAARALKGLQNVAKSNPELTNKILPIAEKNLNSPKGTVKKAAKDLQKSLQ